MAIPTQLSAIPMAIPTQLCANPCFNTFFSRSQSQAAISAFQPLPRKKFNANEIGQAAISAFQPLSRKKFNANEIGVRFPQSAPRRMPVFQCQASDKEVEEKVKTHVSEFVLNGLCAVGVGLGYWPEGLPILVNMCTSAFQLYMVWQKYLGNLTKDPPCCQDGTVDAYERHVFLAHKSSHESWPAKFEDPDSDLLPMLFSVVLKSRKINMNLKTCLTICEADLGLGLSQGDVLIFPDMMKYSELHESNVVDFVDKVLVKGTPWSGGKAEALAGSYIFVCAHNKRDRRCGVCGPILIETFKEMIKSKSLKNQVFVIACSHVGEHKYAGNAIIFSADAEGKTAGHWYGYVAPEDVPELLDCMMK